MKLGITTITISTLLLFQVANADDGHGQGGSILAQLPTSSERIVSTVPSNGDQNPYGVAFVPEDFQEGGPLEPGDILVSNFNGGGNLQGTGTTIVRISRTGQLSVFFQGSPGLGLTTALGVFAPRICLGRQPANHRWQLEHTSANIVACDRPARQVGGDSFRSNAARGSLGSHSDRRRASRQGICLECFERNRDPAGYRDGDEFNVQGKTQIASGHMHHTDPAAVVIGPTGLAYDPERDVLFVASTSDNEVFAVPHARDTLKDNGTGVVIYQDNVHLHGPLGLLLAPNGHLITANGDAVNPGPAGTQNLLVEFTRAGKFVAQFQMDPGIGGGAFGLAITGGEDGVRFAAVDDDANTLDIWQIRD